MKDGMATLNTWIKSLGSLDTMLAKEGPQVVADLLMTECESSIAAGKSLDGYKWPPRVEDGKQAFVNLGKYLSVRIMGTTALLTLDGPGALAQYGTGKMRARPLFPVGGLPDKIGKAIGRGLVDLGVAWMTRAGKHKKAGRMIK